MSNSEPPRKKARLPRANTGCRDCRQRRVKCPEGPVNPRTGRKGACRRCWETDTDCYYPSATVKISKLLKNIVWVEADPFELDGTSSSPESNVIENISPSDSELVSVFSTSPTNMVSLNSPLHFISPFCLFEVKGNPNPLITAEPSAVVEAETDTSEGQRNAFDLALGLGSSSSDVRLDNLTMGPSAFAWPSGVPMASEAGSQLSQARDNTDIDSLYAFLSSSFSSPQPKVDPSAKMESPRLTQDLMKLLFQPEPRPSVFSFSLASLPSGDNDRTVLSYFETQGCNEIVAAPSSRSNWIHSLLFPQIYAFLSTVLSSKTAPGLIRDFAYHSLMQLSFVHRGNIEEDSSKSADWRSEALKHRRLASAAVLKAQAMNGETSWKTEEYLLGFFVRCMADMLDSRELLIDHTTVFELPSEARTVNYTSLQDLLALYSTIQDSCTPLNIALSRPITGPTKPLFELAPEGPDWVEKFVGYSRRTIISLGRVNGMVTYRNHLIRTGKDKQLEGKMLRAQAKALSASLSNPYAEHDLGINKRIERGGIVVRLALYLIVLSELLETSLNDPRFVRTRLIARELVADTLANECAGFQWALTIIGVYTDDQQDRETLKVLLGDVLQMSFGKSYQGTSQVMEMCWEIHDAQGFYTNGIAPWREAITVYGRNLVV